MTQKPRVLFLCTHNSARSQMAEAFLRRHGGHYFEAHSAGLEATSIHPLTYRVMQEVGIDLEAEGQYAKNLYDMYLSRQVHIGYLITVCSRAEALCPTYPGVSVREYWGFEDPAFFVGSEEERLEKFREIRDQLEARVKQFITQETQE